MSRNLHALKQECLFLCSVRSQVVLSEFGALLILADRVRRIKLDNIKHLKEKLGLLCENKEQVDVPGSFNLISANVLPKLKEILQGLFSSNPLDNNHEDSKGDMKNQESSEHGRNSSASIGNGLRTDHVALHQIEESQEKALWRGPAPRPEFAGGRGMPNPNCQPLVVETPPKALSKHQPIQTSSVHHPSKIQHSEGYKYPKCNIIDGFSRVAQSIPDSLYGEVFVYSFHHSNIDSPFKAGD
jgi:hypothetical protein